MTSLGYWQPFTIAGGRSSLFNFITAWACQISVTSVLHQTSPLQLSSFWVSQWWGSNSIFSAVSILSVYLKPCRSAARRTSRTEGWGGRKAVTECEKKRKTEWRTCSIFCFVVLRTKFWPQIKWHYEILNGDYAERPQLNPAKNLLRCWKVWFQTESRGFQKHSPTYI